MFHRSIVEFELPLATLLPHHLLVSNSPWWPPGWVKIGSSFISCSQIESDSPNLCFHFLGKPPSPTCLPEWPNAVTVPCWFFSRSIQFPHCSVCELLLTCSHLSPLAYLRAHFHHPAAPPPWWFFMSFTFARASSVLPCGCVQRATVLRAGGFNRSQSSDPEFARVTLPDSHNGQWHIPYWLISDHCITNFIT